MRRALVALGGCGLALFAGVAWAATGDEVLLRYFTPAELARHDAYHAVHHVTYLFDLLGGPLVVLLLLSLGLNGRLKRWSDVTAARWGASLAARRWPTRVAAGFTRLWGDSGWCGAMLYVAALLLILALLWFPYSLYFSWIYERAHGMSVEPLGRWLWSVAKSLVFQVAAYWALCFGLYGLARRKRRWWLWLGVPSALLLLGAGLLDPFRDLAFYDYVPVPAGPLKERIGEVMKKAKVEYEGIYALKISETTVRADAYLAGQGPTRRIVVFDTFLRAMTPDEAANGVAHEVGHLKDQWAGRSFLASAFLIPYLFLLCWFIRRLGRIKRFGFSDDRDVASLPAAFLFMFVTSVIQDPLAAAYSRTLERRADQYALELLEQPEAFRSMMVKLAKINMSDVHPPALRRLLSGHPGVIERAQAAEEFARSLGIPMPEPTPELFVVPECARPKPR